MPVLCLDSVVLSIAIFLVFYIAFCAIIINYVTQSTKMIINFAAAGVLCLFALWWLIPALSTVCKV